MRTDIVHNYLILSLLLEKNIHLSIFRTPFYRIEFKI